MVLLLYAMHNLLSCGIYTSLVFLVFGTAIPCILQHFNENVFTLVSLLFHCITKCNLAITYRPTLFQLQPALSMYAISFFYSGAYWKPNP